MKVTPLLRIDGRLESGVEFIPECGVGCRCCGCGRCRYYRDGFCTTVAAAVAVSASDGGVTAD